MAQTLEGLEHQWCKDEEQLKKHFKEENFLDFQWPDASASKRELQHIAGVDLKYVADENHAVVSLVILDWLSQEVVYESYALKTISKPIIKGFLGFREAAPLIEVIEQAVAKHPALKPQLILVHGPGKFHTRGFGLACHIGVHLHTPTIGVSTTWEDVDGLKEASIQRHLRHPGDKILLMGSSGTVWGMGFVSSKDASKELCYVSVGNLLTLDSAFELVTETTCADHLPEPIAQAIARSEKGIAELINAASQRQQPPAAPTNAKPRATKDASPGTPKQQALSPSPSPAAPPVPSPRTSLSEHWTEVETALKRRLVEDNAMDFSWYNVNPDKPELRYIAGVAMHIVVGSAAVSVVIIDWSTMEVVFESRESYPIRVPSISGASAFIEAGPMIEAIHHATAVNPHLAPQLVMVYGHGKYHSQAFGVACHVGVTLGITTIGVSDCWVDVDGLQFGPVDEAVKNGAEAVTLRGRSGELYGIAFVTPVEMETTRNAIYVSVGNKISVYTAMEIVKGSCVHNMPEPVFQALRCLRGEAKTVKDTSVGKRASKPEPLPEPLTKPLPELQSGHVENPLQQKWLEMEEVLKGRYTEANAMEFQWYDINPNKPELQYVAGVNLQYVDNNQDTAVASLVILDWTTLAVVHNSYLQATIKVPLIPGFEAHREAGPIVEVIKQAIANCPHFTPQLLMVYGPGKFHSRGFGLACHVGVCLRIATIGVTDLWQDVDGLKFGFISEEVKHEEADAVALRGSSGTLWGFAFELEATKQVAYVSVGHNLEVYTAIEIVKTCCNLDMPEPIRKVLEFSETALDTVKPNRSKPKPQPTHQPAQTSEQEAPPSVVRQAPSAAAAAARKQKAAAAYAASAKASAQGQQAAERTDVPAQTSSPAAAESASPGPAATSPARDADPGVQHQQQHQQHQQHQHQHHQHQHQHQHQQLQHQHQQHHHQQQQQQKQQQHHEQQQQQQHQQLQKQQLQHQHQLHHQHQHQHQHQQQQHHQHQHQHQHQQQQHHQHQHQQQPDSAANPTTGMMANAQPPPPRSPSPHVFPAPSAGHSTPLPVPKPGSATPDTIRTPGASSPAQTRKFSANPAEPGTVPKPAPKLGAGQQNGKSTPKFIRVKDFCGRMPGYTFKKGPQGLGYYQTDPEQTKKLKEMRNNPPEPVPWLEPSDDERRPIAAMGRRSSVTTSKMFTPSGAREHRSLSAGASGPFFMDDGGLASPPATVIGFDGMPLDPDLFDRPRTPPASSRLLSLVASPPPVRLFPGPPPPPSGSVGLPMPIPTMPPPLLQQPPFPATI